MTETLLAISPPVVLLLFGCVLLTWGADEFVERLAGVARWLGLPMLALALLLAGAEPEELATAVTATAQGYPVLAATDAVGANITMLTLGLGMALLVQPLPAGPMLRRYALYATGAGVLAAAALWDGVVEAWEGAGLIAVFVAVVAVIWRTQREPPKLGELAEDEDQEADEEERERSDEDRRSSRRDLWWLLGGLLAMLVGGAIVVDGAVRIATVAGLGQHATGLTALAFATSAEVLALVWAAHRRRLTGVAVAGVLGAVLYNATLTLGVSALVAPVTAPGLGAAALLAAALPLVALLTVWARATRLLGGLLAVGYLGYLAAVLAGLL